MKFSFARFPVALCFCVLVVSFPSHAQSVPEQGREVSTLYPSGHWIYDALEYLSLEAGVASMAVNAPESAGELRVYLQSLPVERLGATGQKLFHRVDAELTPPVPLLSSGYASLDVRPRASVSASWTGDSSARLPFESLLDYNETEPLLSVPLTLSFSPYVTAFSDFSVGEGYWASTLHEASTNIPLDASSFDLNVPSTAYLAAGNSFVTASIGRGPLAIGRTESGSMILSDTADRLDYATLALFSSFMRFSITPIELAPERFAYYHSLQIRPIPALVLTFTESALVHSTLDLRYLNPAMIFHSYAGWRDDYTVDDDTDVDTDDDSSPVGTQMGLSVDFVPVRFVRLYGQFVMNQFQTSYELANYGENASVVPNSLGGLFGVEIVRPFHEGYLKFSFEGVYANPWLYILENHDISYIATRKELVAPSGYASKTINVWLGSPYGPDTIAFNASASWIIPGDRRVGLSWRTICRGTNGDSVLEDESDDYYPETEEAAKNSTPTGTNVWQHTLVVSASFFPVQRLEIDGKLGYSLLYDGGFAHTPFTSLSAAWQIR